jgi:histidinol dehydrogenase
VIPVRRLSELDPASRKAAFNRPGAFTDDVVKAVAILLADVREHGDSALRAYAKKFDKVVIDAIEVPAAEIDAAEKGVKQQEQVALRSALENLLRFHRQGVTRSFEYAPVKGILVGRRFAPYARAGLHATTLPSSVLMAAVPAVVAGVKEIFLCAAPGPDGAVPPAMLFAARIAGVHRVFRTAGAPAIAAMAFGTATIPRVEIIAGPGDRFVNAAKRAVAGDVAIDFSSGPTELLVISDGTGDPRHIAADMVAQSEHDASASARLVTTSGTQAEAVARELADQSRALPRAETIQKALTKHGGLFVVDDLAAAIAFANEYGPGFLSIVCERPLPVLDQIRHAGSVFLGDMSPVAVGDYGVGPNAVVPTLGEARRSSGLTAATFLKSVPFTYVTKEGLASVAPMSSALARLESLEGHLASIEVRQERHGH